MTDTVSCCRTPRPVLVEIQGVYDGGLFYECATCQTRWHRFPEGHWLHARAARYVTPTPPLPPENA